MRRTLLIGLVAALVLAAAPLTAQEAKPRVRKLPDLITAEELAERSDLQSAWDAVQRLRPMWLRIRGAGTPNRSPSPILVYLDGARAGEVDVLRQIRISSVAELRHLDGKDATTRFGTDHGSGAILITPVRSAPPER